MLPFFSAPSGIVRKVRVELAGCSQTEWLALEAKGSSLIKDVRKRLVVALQWSKKF